jgi:hypothetical protein
MPVPDAFDTFENYLRTVLRASNLRDEGREGCDNLIAGCSTGYFEMI